MLGGTSLGSMVLGMVKIKVAAVLLGPAGIGILSVLSGLNSLFLDIFGFGLGSSVVRQIAATENRNEPQELAATVKTLRYLIWLEIGIGVIAILILARTLSKFSFNSTDHVGSILLLSTALLFGLLNLGQCGALQGMRRISELGKVKLLGAFSGCIASIVCFYLFGVAGIAFSLIASAALLFLFSNHYCRKLRFQSVPISFSEFYRRGRPMLALGGCFMLSSAMATGGLYLQKIIIVHQLGLPYCGIFQAAFGLSGILINFILVTMGADYYPRLVGIIDSPELKQKTVNEQLEVALLLGSPGIVLLLLFAPWIIGFFYSSDFSSATLLLRILMIGCLWKILGWSLGFLVFAHNDGRLLVLCEVLSGVIMLLLFYGFLNLFGIKGAALGVSASYCIHGVGQILLARFRYGVRVSNGNSLAFAAVFLFLLLMLYLSELPLPPGIFFGGSLVLEAIIAICCLTILSRRIGIKNLSDLKEKIYLWKKSR